MRRVFLPFVCVVVVPCVMATTTCGRGNYSDGLSCKECSGNTYSDITNASVCEAYSTCQKGQKILVEGSKMVDRTCEACAFGKYTNQVDQVSCKLWSDCDAGTFVLVNGTANKDHQCTTCPYGKYSTTKNSLSCSSQQVDCDSGTYVKSEATSSSPRVCSACDPGKFTSGFPNQQSCKTWRDCPAGTAVSMQGRVNQNRMCGNCPSGRFTEYANSDSCKAFKKDPRCEVWGEGNATYDRQCLKEKQIEWIWIVSSISIAVIIATVIFCVYHVKHLSHPDRQKKIKHMTRSFVKQMSKVGDDAPSVNPVGPASRTNDDVHHGTEVQIELQAGMLVTVKTNTKHRRGSKWDLVRGNKTFFHHPDMGKTVMQLVKENRERKIREGAV